MLCLGDEPLADALQEALYRIGQNAPEVMAAAQTPDVKSALRVATEAAQGYGIFGAPTWQTADGEIFWGNDRLEDAMAWALAAEHAERG